MRKLSALTLDLFLIFTIGFSLVLWFWYVYPYKPLVVDKQPLEVFNSPVKAGEILKYEVNFTKNTDRRPVIYRRFVDGLVYNLPPSYPLNPQGTRTNITSVDIPINLPPGIYTLESTTCYQMNPIREICVEYTTDEFEVTK